MMTIAEKISSKKHIIWDWNGTILNDVDHAIETMNGLLAKFDLNLLDKSRYQKIFTFPIKNYYDALGFDYSLRSFEDLCHDFVDNFMDGVSNCELFNHVTPILNEVKADNKTQSVLSASDQSNLDRMIAEFKLSHLFDYVYGIEDKYGRSKVYRGRQLIEKSGVSLSETVLIGDTIHDLEVGQELGVDVILVSHGHQCRSILTKSHHTVV